MEKLKNIVLSLFALAFIGSLLLNAHHYHIRRSKMPYRDTITTTITDTIIYFKPIPKDSLILRYVTEKLAVSVAEFPKTGQERQDSVSKSAVSPDSIHVVLPITQKVYEDTCFTAYVSGYNASLDSIILHPRHKLITIREYKKTKRWGIGIQVGYGLTITETPGLAPYIGIGISYNL